MESSESMEFDPIASSGSALAEFYFQLADAAAELGDDLLADSFWQDGAKADNNG